MADNKTIEQLEDEVAGLVLAYQTLLNSPTAQGLDRHGRFDAIMREFERTEADSPKNYGVLVQLLHTALFWLAEAKDTMDKQVDGNRRTGGGHRGRR